MKASERHKLKHDKAAETMVSGLAWAKRHQSVIVAVFAAMLLIVGLSYWRASSNQKAAEMASQMLEEMQSRANALLSAKAQGGPVDELDSIVSQFNQIATDNSGSATAAQALRSAGQLLMKAGSAEQALTYFERAAAASNRLPGLKNMATRGIAEALEAMGKPEEAIKQYAKFTTDPFAPEAAQAYWDIGRCYEELKDREKAEEFYRNAAQYGEKTEWAGLAAFRLSELANGAELLGPVAVVTPPSNITTDTPVVAETTTTVTVPEPIAPENPETKATEIPPPPAAPAAAPETPEQMPAEQAQP